MSEVKIFCNGEEIDVHEFRFPEDAEHFFDTYPLDDTADHIELWGNDFFGDYGIIDERNANPE